MNGYTPYRYFPLARLALARVPKAGCTSLTRWANEVERSLAAPRQPATPRNGLHLSCIAAAPPGTLRVTTLRHPVDRVVSVYASKILASPVGEWIFRYLRAPWYPRLESLTEIRSGFRRFVETLAADAGFLRGENIHWRPQSLTVPDIAAFDLVLPTSRLDELPAIVAALRPDLAPSAAVQLNRENAAGTPLADFLLEPDLVRTIERVYADDLALLDRHGIDRVFRRPIGRLPDAAFDVDAELDRLRADRHTEYHRILDRFLYG
ncbi:MAG: sulfotransferase family protein [Rhodocyclaceae bacterium]|nr:sulfotransferase family protein [Rhodocyclaceae bacterium]